MSDQKTELIMEERDKLVNERFTALIQDLARETGEQPVGAIATICWQQEDRVSVAITIGKAPAVLQMKIIDIMARKFTQALGYIKAQINTHKAEPHAH